MIERMVQETPQDSEGTGLVASQVESFQLQLFDPRPVARPDYNIGKYAGVIFIAPQSKKVREVREHVFGYDDETGAKLSVVIHPLKDQKTPTTTTLRVLLGLIDIWYHQGQAASGEVWFSARQLTHAMGKKWQGASSAEMIEDHLSVLRHTSINWMATFSTRADPRNTMRDMQLVTKNEYRPREYTSKKARFERAHRIVLSEALVENMLAGHVRPLNGDTLRSIRNDTTAMLYTLLDLYLASADPHGTGTVRKRSARKLIVEDLQLEGTRYEEKKHRKALLKRLVEELDGRELVRGRLRCWMEESSDKSDVILFYQKDVRRAPQPRPKVKPLVDKGEAEYLAQEICDTLSRLPNGGSPKQGYIEFLARYVPASIMREALSIAKGDYLRSNKKGVTAVFVGIVKKMAEEKGVTIPVRSSGAGATPTSR